MKKKAAPARSRPLSRGSSLLQDLLKAYPESLLLIDKNGTILYSNQVFAGRMGKNAAALIGSCVYDLFPPDVAAVRKKKVEEVVATGTPIRFEDERFDRVIDNYVGPLAGRGRASTRLLIVGCDVTERRRAERAAHESDERLRGTLDHMPVGAQIVGSDWRYRYVNDTASAYGRKSKDEFLGRTLMEVYPGIERLEIFRVLQRCMKERASEQCELEFELADGTTSWFDFNIQPVPEGLFILTLDVTRRQQALAEVESLARFPSENPNPVLRIDGKGDLIYVNASGLDMLNAWRLEIGRQAPPVLAHAVAEALKEGTAKTVDVDIGQRVISFSVSPLPGPGYANLYGRDITQRIHAERELRRQNALLQDLNRDLEIEIEERKRVETGFRQAEDKFEQAFRTSPDSININRLSDGLYLEVNDGFTSITGFAREDVVGRTSVELDIWADPADRSRLVEGLRRDGIVNNLEANFRMKNGAILRGLMSARVIRLNGEECIISITRDITARKQSEEQIKAALLEKEVLLKEIHHRVKNNLQVISSLLSLQAEHIPHAESRKALRESMQRVRSMALAHEKLYRSENLANVHFGEYIETVARDLIRSYSVPGVELSLHVEPVFLQIDKAIPCGLIVNELVSNALAHAFPDGRKGSVTVGLRQRDPETVDLTVHDDGIGFHPPNDLRNVPSMGMSLVVSLVDQISGSISLEANRGTIFTISFPSGPAGKASPIRGSE